MFLQTFQAPLCRYEPYSALCSVSPTENVSGEIQIQHQNIIILEKKTIASPSPFKWNDRSPKKTYPKSTTLFFLRVLQWFDRCTINDLIIFRYNDFVCTDTDPWPCLFSPPSKCHLKSNEVICNKSVSLVVGNLTPSRSWKLTDQRNVTFLRTTTGSLQTRSNNSKNWFILRFVNDSGTSCIFSKDYVSDIQT